MIKEIAVEPEVMATWTHFRDIWDDCGVGRGRLLTEFPPGWRELVCKFAYQLSSAKAASIAAKLKPMPGQGAVKKWIPTGRAYDKGKDWLTNAERHEPSNAYDAIVARKNPREKNRVVVAGEYAKDQPPWKTATQAEIPRTAGGLLGCVRLLLENSHELVLVDCNFKADEPRFRIPLAAFAGVRSAGKVWRRMELHVEHPLSGDRPDKVVLANRKDYMRRHLAELIPAGSTLRVHFWYRKPGGKKLHPRFVLTELGGLQYDFGLDAGDGPGDTTIVHLLEEDIWRAIGADYDARPGQTPAFCLDVDAVLDIPGEG